MFFGLYNNKNLILTLYRNKNYIIFRVLLVSCKRLFSLHKTNKPQKKYQFCIAFVNKNRFTEMIAQITRLLLPKTLIK